jgi:hypothetical protein
LEYDELTVRENQLIESLEEYFHENRAVTDQQESILQGIYFQVTTNFHIMDPLAGHYLTAPFE